MVIFVNADRYKQYASWLAVCLIAVQLLTGMLSPVLMTAMACDQVHLPAASSAHQHEPQCHAMPDHQNMHCDHSCASFNVLIPSYGIPVIVTGFMYRLIIYPLLAGIRFAPPLPPP